MPIGPNEYLRTIRHRLKLGLRDVQQFSAVIAAEEHNSDFYISPSRLTQIETEDSIPSMFKLFSLSTIYRIDFVDLIRRYGLNPDRSYHYRKMLDLDETHPASIAAYSVDTSIQIPVRLDPSFSWNTTHMINELVGRWGTIPAVLLQDMNPRSDMFGYIGLKDYTMFPLLRPGALVLIDGNRRRVTHTGWKNETERPIYFVETREAYKCAWCQIDDRKITLLPHPMSPVAAQSFQFPDAAEIVGQVVGVAMRLVPLTQPDRESGPGSAERSGTAK